MSLAVLPDTEVPVPPLTLIPVRALPLADMPVTWESPPTRVSLTPPRLPSKLPPMTQRPWARLALKPSRAAPVTELLSTVTSSDLSMRIPRPLLVPRTVLPIMLAQIF